MKVHVGDPLIYRPGWGKEAPILVWVTELTITEEPRDKYGDNEKEADWSLVRDNRVCFSFDTGHWGYSDQIDLNWSPEMLRLVTDCPPKELPMHLGKHPAIDKWIAEQLSQEETLDTYIMGDQPATCPLCGARTDFTEGKGEQIHTCLDPKCKYRFRMVKR